MLSNLIKIKFKRSWTSHTNKHAGDERSTQTFPKQWPAYFIPSSKQGYSYNNSGNPKRERSEAISLGDSSAQIITLQNVVVRHSLSQQVVEQSENSWENIDKFNQESESLRITNKNVLIVT